MFAMCEHGSRNGKTMQKKQSGWWLMLINFCHVHFFGIWYNLMPLMMVFKRNIE
jgi:hypothetical protein